MTTLDNTSIESHFLLNVFNVIFRLPIISVLRWFQNDYEVYVETLEGTQTYRLFDHVTVAIQLKKVGAEMHANELSYHLISKRGGGLSNRDEIKFGKSEINFLHELQLNQVKPSFSFLKLIFNQYQDCGVAVLVKLK